MVSLYVQPVTYLQAKCTITYCKSYEGLPCYCAMMLEDKATPKMNGSHGRSAVSVTLKRPSSELSARKIKDSAADWHNFMLKWEQLNDSGFAIAKKIVNMKLSSQLEQESKLELEMSSITVESTKAPLMFNKELDDCCTELLAIQDSMAKLVSKMEKLCSAVKGICDLEAYHHGDAAQEISLFHTWPMAYFRETFMKLAEMYKKELDLKRTIVREIAHATEQNIMMIYLSSWLYQPYIEDSGRLLLESMLLETGHRPLYTAK
ncbi:cyclin-dependent kinase 2-interacting protein [Protopterus annectens]|uniref:cyclin-dependent kinase 2-interacting protein n=1 Tax=Protopterus annectens TaxID=7888 RepID=UPI001CF97D4D|nr:cyclin-dependent kinase 2-interacting protein [Protopterus annectens]